MDYQYAGSASYPRFSEELANVAKLFGGVRTNEVREPTYNKDEWIGHKQYCEQFVFPEGTDEILVRWFNDIYSDNFSVDDTKHIFCIISRHPEIKKISSQIFDELKSLCEYEDRWFIW